MLLDLIKLVAGHKLHQLITEYGAAAEEQLTFFHKEELDKNGNVSVICLQGMSVQQRMHTSSYWLSLSASHSMLAGLSGLLGKAMAGTMCQT